MSPGTEHISKPSRGSPLRANFLVGPTGSGKSGVAQYIAERLRCDILSADSMSVYRGMDAGTAKPGADCRSRARYHGIDIVAPDRTFSAWEYRCHALAALREAASAGRETVVVGGTGLYIRSLTDGLDPAPGKGRSARAFAERIFEEKGVEGLKAELRRRNEKLYTELRDRQNPRRLIRAIELADGGEAPPGSWRARPKARLVGLLPAPGLLRLNIESRARRMFEGGLIREVGALLERYGDLSGTACHAIGYKEAIDVLKGRCTVEAAVQGTMQRTRQLAKRQMTWFRHQAEVEWVDFDDDAEQAAIAERVMELWRRNGPTEIRM